MDNEREVKHLVEQSKMVFLQEIIEDFRRRQSQYDLGTEFAKTRKNRTILVPAVIGVMVLFFAFSAVAITWYTDALTSDIEVSIDEFSDINLRELLDSARRLEAEMEAAQRRRAELVRRRDREISQVRSQAGRDIELLQTRNLSAGQRTQQESTIRSQEEARVAEIRASFDEELDALDLEIEALTEQMAQYDARQVEQAREREALLDNQRQVFELEMEQQAREHEEQLAQLETEYAQQIAELENHLANLESGLRDAHQREIDELILRYNPSIEEGPVFDALSRSFDEAHLADFDPADYADVLTDEGIVSSVDIAELQQELDELQLLVSALEEVPYRNSVPSILEGIERRAAAIIARYEAFGEGLAARLAERDQRIAGQEAVFAAERSRLQAAFAEREAGLRREREQFLYALESLTMDNRENGYIIDARDSDEIYVFMDRLREVNEGGQGYVFRRDDELVAVIEFIDTGNPARTRLVELFNDTGLRPFDRVLLQLQ